MPRRLARLRIAAGLILLVAGTGSALLLLSPRGDAVNRLNVRVWITVTAPLGLQDAITPERFADLMNVLLFIPPFVALAVLVPRWWWVLLGTAISGAVEIYQFEIGTRDASLADVLANTLGAVLGTAGGIALERWARRREARRAAGTKSWPDGPRPFP